MKQRIKQILMQELDYSEYVAEETSNELMGLHPTLNKYLEQWLLNRSMQEIKINQISTKDLIEKRGYTYPAALIAMDWLLKDPVVAEKELSLNFKRG